MAEAVSLKIRPGHADFLDLPWHQSVVDWDLERFLDLPKGISRHEVRFLAYEQGIYVVKELPTRAAQQDYRVLRALESCEVSTAIPVGIVEQRHHDPGAERSAALITRYVSHSFSCRELLQGPGFGNHRGRMLDAFAMLLVQLHLAGCFWGDCSLNNVLYRYDAEAIETIMIDAETALIRDELSRGQREEDLAIMEMNVAGDLADLAASQGAALDTVDFAMGGEISERYRRLWRELTDELTIGPDEHYKITERVNRLNELGFDVDEVDLLRTPGGGRLQMKVKVGGRSFHATRLRELTGIDALERQARMILSDLYYHQARHDTASATHKAVAAVRWRVGGFGPRLERLQAMPTITDPIQSYCDLLYHRYLKSAEQGRDIGTEAAFQSWLATGRPGPMIL